MAANGLLLLGSLLVAGVLAELLTRAVFPVASGQTRVTSDGTLLDEWLQPGASYRQVATEYDALTTITPEGYRVPEVEHNPDVIFIGDSMTFGWGLSDEETFTSLYCTPLELQCANLGSPGAGTIQEVDRLEEYLRAQAWRPREVKFFMFAMTAAFSAGNDLEDNYLSVRWARQAEQGADAGAESPLQDPEPGVLERVLGYRQFIQRHSNLARVAKYYWGPLLRSALVPELDQERLEEALAVTEAALERLEALSSEYGFDYSIYVLHPVQDIMRGTFRETASTLARIAPRTVQTTGHLFEDSPQNYYFAFDGHLNAAGSRTLAEWLVEAAPPPADEGGNPSS